MTNLTRHFVTLCVAIAATCSSLALFAAAEVPAILSALAGLGAFSIVMLTRALAQAVRRHEALEEDVSDDRSVIEKLIGRADAIEARLKTAETRIARSAAEETSAEIATLGALVKELADTISAQEARIAGLARAVPSPARAPDVARVAQAPAAARPQLAPLRAAAPDPPVVASASAAALPPEIDEALAARRIEIHLQPIVTLPQRKVRAYQALALLKTADGRIVPTSELDALGTDERLVAMDEALLLGAVQVVRRLSQKSRDLMLLCALSRGGVRSPALLDQAAELFVAGQGLASHLVLEMPPADFAALPQPAVERLKKLAAAGCRFGLGPIADLKVDPALLAGRAVRFVKVPARMLLDAPPGASEIHVADLPGLLARHGIDLVAEGVETEAMVADLLDLDLRAARGDLFSPARPVRADVMTPDARTRPASPQATGPATPPRPAGPATLGQGALQEAIERLRKVQESRAHDPRILASSGSEGRAPTSSQGPAAGQPAGLPPEGRRRSAWRTLARRVGATDRSG